MRASETDRSLICPASLVIPRPPDHEASKPEKTKRAAAFGTLCHHWKETGETDPEWADPRDTKCLDKKLLLSGISREEWWHGGEHEVTFAIHLPTGTPQRYAGPREGADEWKKSFAPHEYLTGTIDYLYPDGSGDDLKTGDWPVDPAEAGQLRSYALLPWLEQGAPIRWARDWSITQWKKYPQAGLPVRTYAELTGFELADHLEGLRWSATHPEEVNPSEDGCRFCPSRGFACPDGESIWS